MTDRGRAARERRLDLAGAWAAGARLGWSSNVVDHSGHVPHIEQAEGFLELLAGVPRGDSTATVSTREAVG
jgi:hypothetical protein